MKGFTLIEVMISLFILLAGMSGVIKLQVTSAAITKLSEDSTIAQNLAETALNIELARPLTKVVGSPACLTPDSENEIKGVTYKLTCSILKNKTSVRLGSKTIGTEDAPAFFVEVAVTWKDLINSNLSDDNHFTSTYGMIVAK